MLVLIPASVVVLATLMRGLAAFIGTNPRRTAEEIRAAVRAARDRSPGFTRADAIAMVQNRALQEFGLIQPLQIIQAIAPFVGALGTVLNIRHVSTRLIQAGDTTRLADGLERSLFPLIFGLTLGLISAAAYFILKVRLFSLESGPWTEAALEAYEEKGTTRPIPGGLR